MPLPVSTQSARATGLADMAQSTYTPAQLSSLSQHYAFHWNAAAYFVVVFSSLVALIVFAFIMRHFAQKMSVRWRRRARAVEDGESWLINHRPARSRDTKLMDALRRGKISAPMASEDGSSVRPGSRGTATSHEDNVAGRW